MFLLAIILAIVSLFLVGFMSGTIYQSSIDKLDECGPSNRTHTIRIGKDSFTPSRLEANRCDKLVFYNNDAKMRAVVFGTFENHVPYGEFATEYLRPKERVSLKLFKVGTFDFHDHTRQDFEGVLIVNAPEE